MAKATSEAPRERLRLVFLFTELDAKGKPVTYWAREDRVADFVAEPTSENTLVYSGKLKGAMAYGRVRPGMVVSVDASLPPEGGCSIYPATAGYAGRWTEDREALARWEARDLSTRETLKAKSAAKAAMDDGELTACVDKLRKSMSRLSKQRRAHVMAWIVQELASDVW